MTPALRAFLRLVKGEIPGGEITTPDMVRARLPYFVWPDRRPKVTVAWVDVDLSDLERPATRRQRRTRTGKQLKLVG